MKEMSEIVVYMFFEELLKTYLTFHGSTMQCQYGLLPEDTVMGNIYTWPISVRAGWSVCLMFALMTILVAIINNKSIM